METQSVFAAQGQPDPSWSFAECTTKQTTAFTHGYHKYPAKFIPPLAAKLIEEYSKPGDLVGDPFMGSGTTLVEALLLMRRAVGTDINPLAWLIAKAKTTPIDPDKLAKSLAKLFVGLEVNSQGALISPLLAQVPPLEHERIDYWFTEPNRRELAVVLYLINQEPDEAVRIFFLCGFSNVLKNCSRWLMRSSKPTVDQTRRFPPWCRPSANTLTIWLSGIFYFTSSLIPGQPPFWLSTATPGICRFCLTALT